MPKYVGLTVPRCMGPFVPSIYRFAQFHFKGTFCVRDYTIECRSVRLFCFHSSELCILEFICFLYKAYDYLCARLWFCGTFMLRLTFYFPSCCL